jgi:hypothetical protein
MHLTRPASTTQNSHATVPEKRKVGLCRSCQSCFVDFRSHAVGRAASGTVCI